MGAERQSVSIQLTVLDTKLTLSRDSKANPKDLLDKILSIAPILPGQGGFTAGKENSQPPTAPSSAQPTPQKPAANAAQSNLIDLDSRPSSTAPPEPKQATQHTSQPQKNFMDDDTGVSNQMSKLNMHETMQPEGNKPLKRTDTQTSELDVFVDAES
jgi:hypothetical protein